MKSQHASKDVLEYKIIKYIFLKANKKLLILKIRKRVLLGRGNKKITIRERKKVSSVISVKKLMLENVFMRRKTFLFAKYKSRQQTSLPQEICQYDKLLNHYLEL